MGLFDFFRRKKKEGEGEVNASSEEEQPVLDDGNPDEPKKSAEQETPANLTAIATELDRVKASVESFSEVRKSFSERFAQLGEQVGELRAMIMDRDRTIQEVELKAIKAADLVETVQPEKLMIEIQKVNAKFEALKANLEGNEAMMERVMDELKEMRRKLDFFRGVEEIIKLSEEVKKELIDVKKVEADINVQTEKISTMYAEIRKKYQSVEQMSDILYSVKAGVDQHGKDIEFIKSKLMSVVDKDELEKVVNNLQKTLQSANTVQKNSALSKDVAELKQMLDVIKK